jgi:hypothetical protein
MATVTAIRNTNAINGTQPASFLNTYLPACGPSALYGTAQIASAASAAGAGPSYLPHLQAATALDDRAATHEGERVNRLLDTRQRQCCHQWWLLLQPAEGSRGGDLGSPDDERRRPNRDALATRHGTCARRVMDAACTSKRSWRCVQKQIKHDLRWWVPAAQFF